jgi:hypothetical protein
MLWFAPFFSARAPPPPPSRLEAGGKGALVVAHLLHALPAQRVDHLDAQRHGLCALLRVVQANDLRGGRGAADGCARGCLQRELDKLGNGNLEEGKEKKGRGRTLERLLAVQ